MLLTLLLALAPQPVDVTATPFPNDLSGPAGCTVFRTGYILKGDKEFGGISAMRFDGDEATLVADDALLYRGTLTRNQAGFVTGFSDLVRWPLTDENGKRLSKSRGDSEGLVLESGGALISLERQHRISRFTPEENGWAERYRLHTDDRDILETNSGFEALAELKDGRLVSFSEGVDDDGLGLVIFLTRDDGEWVPSDAQYRPAADFRVTDAATDPETGDLFVLERAFSRLRGPRARLVRVAAPDLYEGQVIEGEELVRLSTLDGVDNMEGLTVERRDDGRLLAHIISDDNYNALQRTVLMGFEIDEDCSLPAIAGDGRGAGMKPDPQ